jgi:hypothetical protein
MSGIYGSYFMSLLRAYNFGIKCKCRALIDRWTYFRDWSGCSSSAQVRAATLQRRKRIQVSKIVGRGYNVRGNLNRLCEDPR